MSLLISFGGPPDSMMSVAELILSLILTTCRHTAVQGARDLPYPGLSNTPIQYVAPMSPSTTPSGRHGNGATVEFCQWENLNASCPSTDQVVLMTEARYGRMQFGRCVREDHGNLGCSADVLRQLDARCSGRRSCVVQVPDPTLHNTHTCPKELMPYLEAGYTCVTVVMATSHRSCPVVTTQTTGFFSSLTAVDSGIGIESCPWTIHVEQGRRVNITLFNFIDRQTSSGLTSRNLRPRRSSTFNCEHWNIVIREGNETVEVSVCSVIEEGIVGGPSIVDIEQGARERVIYTSRGGSIILIYLASATASDAVFESTQLRSTPLLLRFNVFGCADVKPIANGVVNRHGDAIAVVKCASGATSPLTCIDGRWTGQLVNCSSNRGKAIESSYKDARNSFMPHGLLLVIGIGVVMGVAMGAIMLLAIIVCLRRRRQLLNTRSQTTDPLLQKTESSLADHLSDCAQCSRNYVDQLHICPYQHHHHHHRHHSVHRNDTAGHTQLQQQLPPPPSTAQQLHPLPYGGADSGRAMYPLMTSSMTLCSRHVHADEYGDDMVTSHPASDHVHGLMTSPTIALTLMTSPIGDGNRELDLIRNSVYHDSRHVQQDVLGYTSTQYRTLHNKCPCNLDSADPDDVTTSLSAL